MFNNLERISFAEWLIELNNCAYEYGYDTAITHITGQFFWHPYYEEGFDPTIALETAIKEGTGLEEILIDAEKRQRSNAA